MAAKHLQELQPSIDEDKRSSCMMNTVAAMPQASGESIPLEFLDAFCLDEASFDCDMQWGFRFLSDLGYKFD